MPLPRYAVHPEVVATQLDDEAVLLNLHTQRYYTLNATGLAIWQLLAAPKGIDEVAKALTEAYEVEGPAARAAAERFLRELLHDGLVQEAA